MLEVRSHPATDDFGIPEVNCSGKSDCCNRTERCGRTQDGAHISGILHGVEDQKHSGPIRWKGCKRVLRNDCDGYDTLGGFSFSGRGKDACVDLFDGDPALFQQSGEGRASWRVEQLRRHEGAPNLERRSHQFLDASNPLGHEKAMLFASFASLEVARQGQEFQVYGTCGEWLLPFRGKTLLLNGWPNMKKLFIAMIFAATTAACAISTQQEVQMGTEYASQINAQLPIVQDAEINRYVNVLGDSIANLADNRGLDYHFYVVNAAEVNAFAVPGGFIYVNRGLIDRTQNLSQLAGVLGHEIGHVVRRHSVKQMEKANTANIGVMLGCTLINVCGNQAAAAAINIGGSALFAKFGRDDEREADAEGIKNVIRAGINPNGIPQMFEILLNERARNPSAVEGWFATHPGEEERIQETTAMIAQYDPAILRSLTTNSTRYNDFKARVRALPAPRTASSR